MRVRNSRASQFFWICINYNYIAGGESLLNMQSGSLILGDLRESEC